MAVEHEEILVARDQEGGFRSKGGGKNHPVFRVSNLDRQAPPGSNQLSFSKEHKEVRDILLVQSVALRKIRTPENSTVLFNQWFRDRQREVSSTQGPE